MSCSCHINPPCSWCVESFECAKCGKICHPDENGQTEIGGDLFCNKCVEEKELQKLTILIDKLEDLTRRVEYLERNAIISSEEK